MRVLFLYLIMMPILFFAFITNIFLINAIAISFFDSKATLTSNPRFIWYFIRNLHFSSIPAHMVLDGIASTDLNNSANLLAKYCSSVFTDSSNLIQSPINTIFPQYNLLCSISFTINDVSNVLSSFRNIKSICSNGIQSDFLFKLNSVIAGPLFALFQKSLAADVFLSLLKSGSITPILKSGKPTLVSNYRLIILMFHLFKLLKTIVLDSIRPALNYIFSDKQHNFRPGRLTTTCNFVFFSFIYLLS